MIEMTDKYNLSEEEIIRDNIRRTRQYTPEQILDNIEKMARFLYDNMTPEAREALDRDRFRDSGNIEDFKNDH